ncbi:MAG: AAA family ATPase [Candidatus Nezhaarchaeota archaeon]|nr:AAA family ATPase [Candidatus Nezhaarchaeota archaeon]
MGSISVGIMDPKTGTGPAESGKALSGLLQAKEITLIYGEPGAGKTSLSLELALRVCLQGYKVLYVYTDGLFPLPRLERMRRSVRIPSRCYSLLRVLHASSFEELESFIYRLENGAYAEYPLVVLDTFTGPYRSFKVSNRQEIIIQNKKLNQLLAILKGYVMPVEAHAILTSRLKTPSPTDEDLSEEPIASTVMTYWSDNVLSISKSDLPLQRKLWISKLHGCEVNIEVKAYVAGGRVEEADR